MSLTKHEEDLQYFQERAKVPVSRNTYCEQTIRLLSTANVIYTGIKKTNSK
jgi:hypothetical protein